MTPSPDTERRYTIRQWEKLKGIKILDPDGFNRKNPDLMECLFTEQEFDDGAMGSTIQSISPTENTEELKIDAAVEAYKKGYIAGSIDTINGAGAEHE